MVVPPSLKNQLLVVAAVALLALAVPATRPALLVVTNWLAAALIVVGVARHRPARRVPWRLAVAFVALVAVGNTATVLAGHQTVVTIAATSAGQLCAAAALPALLRDGSARRRDAATALEIAILAAVVGLFVVELLLVGLDGAGTGEVSWAIALTPALDAVLIGVLLWAVLFRARVVPALVVVLLGAFCSLVFDLLCTLGGQRAASPDEPLAAMGTANMLLFGVAALHPSMAVLGVPAGAAGARRPSVQLLLVLPVAVLPVGMLAVRDRLHVDAGVVVSVVLVVVVLAFARAVVAVKVTEANAERDPLTRLLNRTGLDRAHTDLTAARPAGAGQQDTPWLLLVDLDDFKRVNDRFGHRTGDALLVAVAARLRETVGSAGVVARHGGDEFIVLLDASSTAQTPAVEPAAPILAALAHPVTAGRHQVQVSASVGGALLRPGHDLEADLADADIALYRAKRLRGPAFVAFSAPMREETVQETTAIDELRALLSGSCPPQRRAAELVVRYQPIVELATGATVGAEALVRWNHPERGLLGPGDFLHLVEADGMGATLDAHVLTQALTQLREWNRGRTTPLTMSVNLGLSSMCDPGLRAWVDAAIRAAGVAPATVRLEITEHDQLPDDDAITANLTALVDMGCALSLDDFGVGYTSLSYLQRFPVSVLKLDRSLVTGTHASPELLSGIAALSACLSLDMLAEGIETSAQHEAAHRLGITYGQGYHYARPLDPDQFASLLGAVVAIPRPALAPDARARGVPRDHRPSLVH